MVVAEALACGTPVVASNVGGVPEIMSRPSAGELVPPGSVEALADALARVATAPLDTDAVAGSSGAHPWSEQAAAIAEVYLDVLDRREALS